MSIEIINVVGLAASAVASVLAVLIKQVAQRRFPSTPTRKETLTSGIRIEGVFAGRDIRAGSDIVGGDLADKLLFGVTQRVHDVQTALLRQQSLARANRWMSGLLTVGQYIIGGLLASSFVQQSLSREMVGGMGLLVLLSSLIYQHFRPDIQLRGAMGRSLRLRALLRQVEDDIYAFQTGAPSPQSVADFRRRISSALSEIEASELQDVNTRSGEESQSERSNT